MIILTTSFNCEKYIERSLRSIQTQHFSDFTCYVLDDMSTDDTVSKVQQFAERDDRFKLLLNDEKLYQPGNYDKVIRRLPGHEICVEVDGDDYLPDDGVFTRVHNLYNYDSDVWLANGSFVYHDGRPGLAKMPQSFDNIRQSVFSLSHLRTWKAFLWNHINQSDLMNANGKYWSVAGDLAFMFPMFEMAGKEHYRFMDTINYIYNEANPLNDHKVNMQVVDLTVKKIRNMPPYLKLVV